jgi:nitric oxide reductase NorQ protein
MNDKFKRRLNACLIFSVSEGISENIISQIEKDFRVEYPISGKAGYRVPEPKYMLLRREVWEEAATALLSGENLLLVGPKATGKNVLAENLAACLRPPGWDISFYLNTDAASLIGTDTFKNGRVSRCAAAPYISARKTAASAFWTR